MEGPLREVPLYMWSLALTSFHLALQRLHDKAIEKRTGLKVKMEAEQQKQDLTDSKLLNEQQRSVLRE